MPPMQLPAAVRERLVYEIYRQANNLDWEFLSNGEKTAQYRSWIEDPKVGGVLLAYGPEKDARVWIKDVPMKEYARAQEGIGLYTRYAVNRFRGAGEIVQAAFGDGWTVKPDSIGEKPNHCYATNGESTRYVCWGRPGTFRDLVWAAINEAISSTERPAIVIATRDGENISTADRKRQVDITKHCSVSITHLHRTMIPNPEYTEPAMGA
ncbi:hypothetical protein [Streptomyces sp. AV19]|uniref:hypothetical protein n=1 Tax=Streptomyces sp. AV19 TaxID=2793068 RepID=UPI0018FECC4E|nr:hypothetical protein [Streptomyces sp. AV19]MDG4531444.1 hypothetical protein [Streptomyces sp. AV19]